MHVANKVVCMLLVLTIPLDEKVLQTIYNGWRIHSVNTYNCNIWRNPCEKKTLADFDFHVHNNERRLNSNAEAALFQRDRRQLWNEIRCNRLPILQCYTRGQGIVNQGANEFSPKIESR